MSKASTHLLPATASLLCTLLLPLAVRAESPALRTGHTAPLEVQYRGCDAAGWCRFWIETRQLAEQPLLQVRPDGVPQLDGNDAIAVRDRLNALLASMVHQHKRIVLHDLRERDDGMFAAKVTVNEADLAADPTLAGLLREFAVRDR